MQVAEVELVYRSKVKHHDRPVVVHNTDAYTIFLEHWNAGTIELIEEFKLLLLNRAHRVLGICALSRGGMTGTIIDPKLVFITALKTAATSIILCHNHPSGNLRPSERDKQITQQLKEAGALLEIRVLDHLIISGEGYYSFADEGLL
jgi:DNA repair protein RadC